MILLSHSTSPVAGCRMLQVVGEKCLRDLFEELAPTLFGGAKRRSPAGSEKKTRDLITVLCFWGKRQMVQMYDV